MMNTTPRIPATPPSVLAQIARLPELPMPEIKALWQKLFGADTPNYNRRSWNAASPTTCRKSSSARSTPICWSETSVGSNPSSKRARSRSATATPGRPWVRC
jgi:hypothetical protein